MAATKVSKICNRSKIARQGRTRRDMHVDKRPHLVHPCVPPSIGSLFFGPIGFSFSEGENMAANLILATLATVVGALDALVQRVSTSLTAALLLVEVDVWVIIVVIGCTIIIIIVIVIRTARRQ